MPNLNFAEAFLKSGKDVLLCYYLYLNDLFGGDNQNGAKVVKFAQDMIK